MELDDALSWCCGVHWTRLTATLVQAYLDDFDKFCQRLGGATAEVMGDLLSFEVCHP